MGAEDALFQFAESDPRLYTSHAWRTAALRRHSPSAARRLVDWAASDVFDTSRVDGYHFARQLGSLLAEHPDLRLHTYVILQDRALSPGITLLARSVAEEPDAEGILLLAKMEIEGKGSFVSWHTIENVVTEHAPDNTWAGAYNVVPVPATELRRKLLAMTVNGGSKDAAARFLTQIDKIRDDYGAPQSEPRHPDLSSSRAWPIFESGPR